jgi:hypothetical protein
MWVSTAISRLRIERLAQVLIKSSGKRTLTIFLARKHRHGDRRRVWPSIL